MAYKDKEKGRAYQAAWRAKPESKEKRRAWYAKNGDKVRAQERAWRAKPEIKEKRRAQCRAWSAKPESKEKAALRAYKYIPRNIHCGCCGVVLTRPNIDHDHTCCREPPTCGKCTRENLCHSCNTSVVGRIETFLSKFGLDPACLPMSPDPLYNKAVAYILKWRVIHGRALAPANLPWLRS